MFNDGRILILEEQISNAHYSDDTTITEERWLFNRIKIKSSNYQLREPKLI